MPTLPGDRISSWDSPIHTRHVAQIGSGAFRRSGLSHGLLPTPPTSPVSRSEVFEKSEELSEVSTLSLSGCQFKSKIPIRSKSAFLPLSTPMSRSGRCSSVSNRIAGPKQSLEACRKGTRIFGQHPQSQRPFLLSPTCHRKPSEAVLSGSGGLRVLEVGASEDPIRSEVVSLRSEVSRLTSLVEELSSQLARSQVSSRFRMPFRGDPTAPVFDGSDANLRQFLEDVGSLGSEAGLGDKEKIGWALRYASEAESEVWALLPASGGGNFASFADAVIGLYPGAARDYRKRFCDLEALVESQKQKEFASQVDFGCFHRDFLRISLPLVNQGRLSLQESSRVYLRAFHAPFRSEIEGILASRFPNQHPDDPFSVAEINLVALSLLYTGLLGESESRKDVGGSEELSESPKMDSSGEQHPIRHSDTVLRDKLDPKNTSNRGICSTSASDHSPTFASPPAHVEMPALSLHLQKLESHRSFAPIQPFPVAQLPSLSPRPTGCLFCSDMSHHIRRCPLAAKSIKEGKCIIGSDGRVCLSDGRFIPRVPGLEYLGDRVDAYWVGRVVGGRGSVSEAKRGAPTYQFPAFAGFSV